MKKNSNKLELAVAGLLTGLTGMSAPVWAAGGHYAVDDAAILEPGQCQAETWLDRETSTSRRLLHLGPACRIGPVEIGLNLDRVRPDESASSTVFGPQLKWAHPVTEHVSIGLVASANWQSLSPRFLGSTLVVPVTLQLSEPWLVHINIGRDFLARQAGSSRSGAALEWAPSATWSVLGERFRDGGANHWRLGGRWNLTPAMSLDLSRTKGLGAQVPGWWTLGLNVVVDR